MRAKLRLNGQWSKNPFETLLSIIGKGINTNLFIIKWPGRKKGILL